LNEYAAALSEAMAMLVADQRTVFLGQAVMCPGTYMTSTFANVPEDRKIEMPVAEEMQMGISIGLALSGYIPISVYPRWNFLLLAANQLVNHLDKMVARVIVRVGVGSERPLYPGAQHVGDFSSAFRLLMPKMPIITLDRAGDVISAYRSALAREGPSVLVEYADKYVG